MACNNCMVCRKDTFCAHLHFLVASGIYFSKGPLLGGSMHKL